MSLKYLDNTVIKSLSNDHTMICTSNKSDTEELQVL